MTDDRDQDQDQLDLPLPAPADAGIPAAPGAPGAAVAVADPDGGTDAAQDAPAEDRPEGGPAEPRKWDGNGDGLEGAFARAEADAEAAMRAANGVVALLKRARAADGLRGAMATLAAGAETVAGGWRFDEEAYLDDGRFAAELSARAGEAGLRVSELDGRLYAYPVLLRPLPADRAVLIDRTRERRIRPSVLVRLLAETQRRPPKFRPAEFLAALHRAYEAALGAKAGRSAGAVVPLAELHELLTLLPGGARDYPRQEFARDVYLLDQSGEVRTRSGARIEFHAGAGAGTRLARGTLTVVTQGGAERQYHGVSFVPAAAAPEG